MAKVDTVANKQYVVYPLSEDTSLFTGYYQDKQYVPEDILRKLSKDLGFSYDLYQTLLAISPQAATSLVQSMSKQSQRADISLLIDEEKVISYSLEAPRTPLLNSDFIHRAMSLAETSQDIQVSEVHYHKDDTIAYVMLKRVEPIVVEEKYTNRESKCINYHIGILVVNDELSTSYCRLVLYVEDHPVYLPASYYSATASRFKRSSANAAEALELLMLRVIEDLRGDELQSRIVDLHYMYRANKDILSTYEEYNTLLKTMRRIPTIIEDNSYLEDLLRSYENFEKKYVKIDDQKSSYIWRCTAMSGVSIGELINLTIRTLKDVSAPPVEYTAIRELLGSYISTNRIATEIAEE